jgi:type IV pilus assembly protein PilW
MIDADNDGVNGGPGDYQRIAAVRIAVVARGKNVEKPAPGGSAAPPRWRRPCSATGAVRRDGGADAVNVAVAGDPVSWKCYRYRVFETIVPILNSQYRP